MARFANVEVPADKQIQIALTYVYGIGPKTARDIVHAANIDPTTRTKNLTEAEEKRLRDIIDANYMVEGDLHRVVANNVKRLKDIGTYRGLRHKLNLPVRGQNTRTNARTKRGKRVAIGGSQPKAASKT
ncbi:30S ribosomal protein S13 [Candidatus Saccharibacteria bacterium]|nr:30S ribosomal protein S13 [Candidatus Saccharibacteria bacterium]